jgi:hypothetical protein
VRKWAAPAIQPLAVLLDDDDDGGPTPLPPCLCLSWAREERFARLLRRLAVGVSGVGGGEWTTRALSKRALTSLRNGRIFHGRSLGSV